MLETSMSDFYGWLEFFERELYEFQRSDYFLAQIAIEVRRSIQKEPRKDPPWSNFLFINKKILDKFRKKIVKILTPEEKKRNAKRKWLSLFGIENQLEKKE